MELLDRAAAAAVPAALRDAIGEVLRQRLGGFAVNDVAIRPAADHDGDPVIQVEVKHGPIDRPIDFQPVFGADRAARDLAWDQGERRFVHIHHLWNEKQQVADTR